MFQKLIGIQHIFYILIGCQYLIIFENANEFNNIYVKDILF